MSERPAIPANKEAEEAVLASALIDNSTLYEIEQILSPDDFYYSNNKVIYAAMIACWQARQPVDIITLAAKLDAAGQLNDIGGQVRLVSLLNATPTAAYAAYYANLVREASSRRRLLAAASQIAQLAYDSDINAAITRATDLLTRLFDTTNDQGDGFLSWQDSFAVWADGQLERSVEHASKKPKLTMPWRALNFVRPLRGGTLAVVAAAPGVGKTAFAENLAEFWARRGFQVLFQHLELSHQVMLDRRTARWSGEPMEVIERGELTRSMQQADDNIRAWPGAVHYQECSGWGVGRLIAEARRRRSLGQCDVLIVDYFNKIALDLPAGVNVTTARGQVVEALKTFAEREGVPVVLLAQLSKEGKQSERKTGVGVRDTGEIEDKCNLLITLDRPILATPLVWGNKMIPAGKRTPATTARVDKQTLGDIGDARLVYIGERFMFADVQETK